MNKKIQISLATIATLSFIALSNDNRINNVALADSNIESMNSSDFPTPGSVKVNQAFIGGTKVVGKATDKEGTGFAYNIKIIKMDGSPITIGEGKADDLGNFSVNLTESLNEHDLYMVQALNDEGEYLGTQFIPTVDGLSDFPTPGSVKVNQAFIGGTKVVGKATDKEGTGFAYNIKIIKMDGSPITIGEGKADDLGNFSVNLTESLNEHDLYMVQALNDEGEYLGTQFIPTVV